MFRTSSDKKPDMSEHTEIVDRYFQGWNEPDAAKRQALLKTAFAAA